MYNNFSSKKTKKVISALLASALVVTSGPITADAATAKVVGIKKTFTVSASATNKVTGLSKAEKKVVKVTKKGKKFTIKGLKAGKATFKIGKKSYTVKVGATAVKTAKAKLTLTKGKAATVKFTATAGNGDTVAFASSNKNVTLSKKSAKIAKNVASVKVTAKKAGTAKITATSKATGKKATVTVTVKNPAPVATTPGTSNTPSVTTGAATNTPEATATTEATTTPEVTATPVATATGSATATPEVTNTPEVTSGAATATPEVTNTPEVTSGAATATPEVTATPTAAPATVTLAAVTASAISTNKIAVEFNKTVTASAIKADDVVVTENSERRFVKSVTADAKNDKVLVVEFYDNLTSGKTYNVALTIEGKTFAMNVAYTQGTASKIVVADQTIPADDATSLKYTVLDANGLDITDVTNVTFTSDKQDAISDGKITLTDKATAFVKITCTVTNGTTVTTVTSDQFTVRAEAKVAKTLANYTTAITQPNFAATDYKQDLNVLEDQMNAKLFVQLKDQFQNEFTTRGTTYESLDTSVAVVDKTTGAITPIKVGTAPVKITNGTFTQTIMISVVAKSTVQKIVVKDNALTIYPGLTNKTATTNVKLEDQYGKASYTGLTATVKAGADLVTINTDTLATDGNLSVTAKAADKTGTAVIEVSNGTFKQNIAVSLVALGTVVGYDVTGIKPTLDKNTSSTSTDSNYQADEMTFTVNPVDKDGKIAGDPANFTYTVKSGTDEVIAAGVAANTATIKIGTKGIAANKTYTVTVKVGNMEVKTFQFNTIDTRKAPAVIVAKQSATITKTAAAAITDKNKLAEALQTAKVLSVADGCTLKNLDFVTTDSVAITPNGEVKEDGTIVLKSVDVTDAKNDTYTVKLSGNLTIKVVNGVAAGEPTVVEGVTAVEGSNQVVTVTVGKDVTGTGSGDKILGVGVSEIQGSNASEVATAIADKFKDNKDWTAKAEEAVITFTAKEKAANVVDLNMAGEITSEPDDAKISYKTTKPGLAPVEGKKASYTTTIVTNNVAGTAKVTAGGANNVEVTVASTDSAETIAKKIAAALNGDKTFNASYKASNNGSSLTIEQNTAATTSKFADDLGFGLTF